VLQHPLVVAQARVDAARRAAARIDRKAGREGERPLFEPLRAQRFFAKWLIAGPMIRRPRVKKQVTLQSKIGASWNDQQQQFQRVRTNGRAQSTIYFTASGLAERRQND
jgi:hypothetical protein